ncbi:MAG TPA: peptidoglycan DD-metalloendopeptidase family protein [Steroidobacteraceae bacterium]|nr:peptidoglycan DD-metalloendopeptidase family protein [Steroidobacteraceae bacterium]
MLVGLPMVLGMGAFAAARQTDKEAELKELRTRIEGVRKSIEADTQRRDSMARDLKDSELAVQSSRVKIGEIRSQRIASEKQLSLLHREQTETEQQIAAERSELAKQLRAAYIAGEQEPLVLLLNQQSPADLNRMLAYYGYFARSRAERLKVIADRLAHLDFLSEKTAAETQRLKDIEATQTLENKHLAEARNTRAQTLATMQTQLRNRTDQVAQWERQAKALARLIEELQRAAKDFPVLAKQAFARTQGKLPWPVNGKVLANFGELRAGGPLKWEGILIGAPAGTQVRAMFHGRVVYADFLFGMGLMVILDHGDGYSSIYGHNEQLFCKVGDTVAPGDVLGVLAEQGGVEGDRGSLHLEIRKGKEALDPRKWLRKP